MTTILYFVVMAAVMIGLSKILPGFQLSGAWNGWGPALIASIVLAVVNTIVKPILFVITLPFTILTLGLFLFVLNMICLWLTSVLVPGFRVSGFLTTLLASLVLAVVSMIWKSVTSGRD